MFIATAGRRACAAAGHEKGTAARRGRAFVFG